MTGLAAALGAFHFIRPWWLLVLPVLVLLWWLVRRSTTAREAPADGLAPHLRAALTVGAEGRRRFTAIDGAMISLALIVLGAAGPTWSRVPDPFVAQTAPMVIALEVTESMNDSDVAPTRLARAKQKIRDLLELRAGARTALVAYAGTAHRVVPMTEDPRVMQPYLEGLEPEVMPQEGADASAALSLATDILGAETSAGGVLFVADGLQTANVRALTAGDGPPIAFLVMLPADKDDAGIDQLDNLTVVRVTPDAGDVRQIDRALSAAYRSALLQDEGQPWDDRGWLLAWPAALLVLIWFRRGWTMRWYLLPLLVALLAQPRPAHADGIVDWFLTPDQQGRLAYQRKDYDRAAERFVDPMWQGYALYRDGQYAEATQVLGRLDTAEAAFAQGMAHIKNREYRDGVRAFETALERDPDYPGAAENLEIAQTIVDYVERVREQSDTGEEQGIGADDVVFDNEAARGVETQIEAEEGSSLLTAEQWMNTVDTRTGDFLRQRFLIEAVQEP